MLRCKLAVCGDRVIQDAVLGNASIIHIIDRIAAEGFPVLVPRLACLFLLARDDRDEASYADGEVNIFLGEERIVGGPTPVDFQSGYLHRQVVTIEGLIVPKPGTLRAVVSVGGAELGSFDIPVLKVGQQQLPLALEEGGSAEPEEPGQQEKRTKGGREAGAARPGRSSRRSNRRSPG